MRHVGTRSCLILAAAAGPCRGSRGYAPAHFFWFVFFVSSKENERASAIHLHKDKQFPGTCGLGAFPFPYPCFINKLMIRKSRYECFYDLRGGFTLKSGLTVPSISPYSCSCLRMLSRIKTRIWLFTDRPSYSATKLNLFSISSSMRMDTLFTAIKSPQNKFMMTLFYANIMI